MNSIDLFAGAGGLSLGLCQAGIDVVLANEIEQDFAATYRENHPGTKMCVGDIAEIDFAAEVESLGFTGKIQLVCGGPPCQGFSTVGKKDIADPRNSLFQQFLRCLDEVNPHAILFENVAGFSTMYQGQAYHRLVEQLTRRGFTTDMRVLNAADFGLPRNTESERSSWEPAQAFPSNGPLPGAARTQMDCSAPCLPTDH